jgi:hypothetical protein
MAARAVAQSWRSRHGSALEALPWPVHAGRVADRLELELYADRLARHAERLRDDVDGARLRIAWSGIETVARAELGARDVAVLEALGALVQPDAAAERRLLERRLRQLECLERLQAIVEQQLEAENR